jgi:hypothetical protein
MTGQLIGPFNEGEWKTMIMLKSNIAWMKITDAGKYSNAITKETSLLRKYMSGELIAANDNQPHKQRAA